MFVHTHTKIEFSQKSPKYYFTNSEKYFELVP